MIPKLSQQSFCWILVILVLSQVQGCICQSVSPSYETCSQPFRCANQQDVRYPFYGKDRSVSCGYQGFELDCSTEVPLITIDQISYRVLDMENNTYGLKVARGDLWNNTCPGTYRDTTLNYDLFSFSPTSNDQNITLKYGCSIIGTPPQFQQIPAYLNISCGPGTWNMVWTTQDAVLNNFISCSSSILVPLNQTAANGLAATAPFSPVVVLQDALASGFWIQWSADNGNCQDCEESGGVCGYNQDSASFACHCRNGTFPLSCNNTGNGKASGSSSNNTGLKIGPPLAGAAVAGIVVGWLIFHYKQKRKNRITPKSAQNTSKETSTPPSSISLSTPSFTKSSPSYPTSKSNLTGGSAYFGAYLFSYAELEEATNNFDPSRELGDGGFGAVYYGKLPDDRAVAVKRLYENNVKRVDQFMNEVEILTKLRHQNLVILYGCTSKRSRDLLLVYEYIPNGTVADHLHGNRSKSGLLSWPIRMKIAIETADALAYLHRSDIIHRDVKTNNVLLDNDFNVKVADFGLSRLFPADMTHVSTAPQGTPGYVDPEYYQFYQLTEKSDVYSFGVMLTELISSLQAVDTNRHRQDINLASMAINKIQNRNLNELVDTSLGFETNSKVRRMVTLVAELAFRCLQQDRDMRPSMGDVLEALRRIQNEDLNGDRVEIVDILEDDDVVLLKDGIDHPVSPDSVFLNKWNSSSTPDSSV